jgi:hypothetical protein
MPDKSHMPVIKSVQTLGGARMGGARMGGARMGGARMGGARMGGARMGRRAHGVTAGPGWVAVVRRPGRRRGSCVPGR